MLWTNPHSMLSGILKNFKYFNRDPHSIVSYGPKVEYKHSLKSYIEGQFFENSQPGFEPATLKSLMKNTSARWGEPAVQSARAQQ